MTIAHHELRILCVIMYRLQTSNIIHDCASLARLACAAIEADCVQVVSNT